MLSKDELKTKSLVYIGEAGDPGETANGFECVFIKEEQASRPSLPTSCLNCAVHRPSPLLPLYYPEHMK